MLKKQKPIYTTDRIINGKFDFWCREIIQTSSGYGSDDRWFNQSNYPIIHSKEPMEFGSIVKARYFSRTVIPSVNPLDAFIAKYQRIENVALFNKPHTLRFYAKADAPGSITTDFTQCFGDGGSTDIEGISIVKHPLTTDWQTFAHTIDYPSYLYKTFGPLNTTYLQLRFIFSAGAYYDSISSNLGPQTGAFDLADISLVEGTDPSYRYRSLEEEHKLCMRYYQKTYELNTIPGTPTTNNGRIMNMTGRKGTLRWNVETINLPVPMRTTPTVTLYSSLTGTAGVLFFEDNSTGDDFDYPATPIVSHNKIGCRMDTAYYHSSASQTNMHYALDAEL